MGDGEIRSTRKWGVLGESRDQLFQKEILVEIKLDVEGIVYNWNPAILEI